MANHTICPMRDGFQIQGLRGYTLSIGYGTHHYCENLNKKEAGETTTMEVAIMDRKTREFVCLPYDVEGNVSVANLGLLIEAVEAHDWERVNFLCDTNQ